MLSRDHIQKELCICIAVLLPRDIEVTLKIKQPVSMTEYEN